MPRTSTGDLNPLTSWRYGTSVWVGGKGVMGELLQIHDTWALDEAMVVHWWLVFFRGRPREGFLVDGQVLETFFTFAFVPTCSYIPHLTLM